MSRSLAATLVLVAVAGATVIAGPKFTSVWASPEIRTASFAGKKVAALVMTGDESLRVSGEEALARELTARGIQGVAAYRLIPREELQDPDKARGWFERANVEGVVVLRPVSSDRERTYIPPVWSGPYYGTLWGYYGYGWTGLYTPGYVREDLVVIVETAIYSVPRNLLLWGAVSETKNPKDLQKSVKDLVNATAKEMKKQGLTRAATR